MFKTESFLGNKKSSFNQNVWRDNAGTSFKIDNATLQQDIYYFVAVLGRYFYVKSGWNMTKYNSVVQL